MRTDTETDEQAATQTDIKNGLCRYFKGIKRDCIVPLKALKLLKWDTKENKCCFSFFVGQFVFVSDIIFSQKAQLI